MTSTHAHASAKGNGTGHTNRRLAPRFVYLYSNPLIHGDEQNFLDLDLSGEITAVHRALTDSGKQVRTDWWMFVLMTVDSCMGGGAGRHLHSKTITSVHNP